MLPTFLPAQNKPYCSISGSRSGFCIVFDANEQSNLKDELPAYLSKVADLDKAMIHLSGGK